MRGEDVMLINNYGIQNEYDFVQLFNNKYYCDLDDNSKIFLKDLFGDDISSDEKIISWKNKAPQKSDIFVKYKNRVRGISLKCGNNNSIHHEPLFEFKRYLEGLNVPYKIINYYVSYHFGYGRDENGTFDVSRLLSSKEYKQLFQFEINLFNKEINKTRMIIDMVDRFLVRGRNSEHDIDALVCGTIDDYVWIKKHDLYDLILSNRDWNYTSPHISSLTIGPKKRNLDGLSKCVKDRYIVCIRWNHIRKSIIDFKNNHARL